MTQPEDSVALPADEERNDAAAARPPKTSQPASATGPRQARKAEPPVLPEVTRDELDDGWGDGADDRDEWYLRERPPHHE